MEMILQEDDEFQYVDEGKGELIVLLHGLFGALSNWRWFVEKFSKDYRILIPMLPIYGTTVRKADLDGLVSFLEKFVEKLNLNKFVVMGRKFTWRPYSLDLFFKTPGKDKFHGTDRQ